MDEDEKKLEIALGTLSEKQLEDLLTLLNLPEVVAIAREDEANAKANACKSSHQETESRFDLVH